MYIHMAQEGTGYSFIIITALNIQQGNITHLNSQIGDSLLGLANTGGGS